VPEIDEPLCVLDVISGLGVGGAGATLLNLVTSPQNKARPLAVAVLVGHGKNRERLEAAGIPVFDILMSWGLSGLAGLVAFEVHSRL